MNSLLPEDIRILKCISCSSKFNPNTDTINKEYHYYFCTNKVFNPMFNDIVTHITFNRTPEKIMKFDISLMQKACELFIGEHDFYSFAKKDMKLHSTCRTILDCKILKVPNSVFGNKVYYLKIIGKGFLTHMVRYIAGALFALGRSQLKFDDISNAIENHKETKLTAKAKSNGLHLMKICY